MRSYVHVNLCLSLMAAQFLFLVGIDRTENQVHTAIIKYYMWLVSCALSLRPPYTKQLVASNWVAGNKLPCILCHDRELLMRSCRPLATEVAGDRKPFYFWQLVAQTSKVS